jgi:uncharacterized membrane protein
VTARSAESSRSPLWAWPTLTAAGAGVAGVLLGLVRPSGGWLVRLWPGDVDSASTLLQIVATAVITVATLTFSLTVVALQLASQQFSPRLLREVTRDRVSKTVLSVLGGTFVFSCTVVRGLDAERPVPVLAVFVVLLAGIASLGCGLAFITHITRVLRVDTMMLRVHDETHRAIEQSYPLYGDPRPRAADELDVVEAQGIGVSATSSGFVRTVDVARLVRAAQEHDGRVRLRVRPGDHVVQQSPMATVWVAPTARESLSAEVRAAVVLDYERTLDQDAAFGLRLLEDIAVKAVSPAINDPVTAATALGHMADLVVRLVGRRLGAVLHEDAEGTGRVVVPDRDLRYHLDLCCGQVSRFGRAEPTVLTAVLGMLRDVAAACRDDEQRSEVARAARLTAALAPGDHPGQDMGADVGEDMGEDMDTVADMHRRVGLALAGDLDGAYADRSGETRSI